MLTYLLTLLVHFVLLRILNFFFHVPCLDVWTLTCLALADRVQRSCTELFHTFSLDYFPDVSLIKPEDSFNHMFKAVLDSVSWGRTLVNSVQLQPFEDYKI